MNKLLLLCLFALSLGWLGCKKESRKEIEATVEFRGNLRKLEVSSFQYGTHLIENESKRYALKSATVNLDQFIGKTVSVRGHLIAGYPVENGSEFLLVKEVGL